MSQGKEERKKIEAGGAIAKDILTGATTLASTIVASQQATAQAKMAEETKVKVAEVEAKVQTEKEKEITAREKDKEETERLKDNNKTKLIEQEKNLIANHATEGMKSHMEINKIFASSTESPEIVERRQILALQFAAASQSIVPQLSFASPQQQPQITYPTQPQPNHPYPPQLGYQQPASPMAFQQYGNPYQQQYGNQYQQYPQYPQLMPNQPYVTPAQTMPPSPVATNRNSMFYQQPGQAPQNHAPQMPGQQQPSPFQMGLQ